MLETLNFYLLLLSINFAFLFLFAIVFYFLICHSKQKFLYWNITEILFKFNTILHYTALKIEFTFETWRSHSISTPDKVWDRFCKSIFNSSFWGHAIFFLLVTVNWVCEMLVSSKWCQLHCLVSESQHNVKPKQIFHSQSCPCSK